MPQAVVRPDIRVQRMAEVKPIFDELDALGWSRSQLARQLGISSQRLSYYEMGDNPAPAWLFERTQIIFSDPQHAPHFPPPPRQRPGRRRSRPFFAATGTDPPAPT